MEDLIAQADERLDRFDILVLNAAAATARQAVANTDLDVWAEALATNARGAFLLVRHATRRWTDCVQRETLMIRPPSRLERRSA